MKDREQLAKVVQEKLQPGLMRYAELCEMGDPGQQAEAIHARKLCRLFPLTQGELEIIGLMIVDDYYEMKGDGLATTPSEIRQAEIRTHTVYVGLNYLECIARIRHVRLMGFSPSIYTTDSI
jgi:hypothetical protein